MWGEGKGPAHKIAEKTRTHVKNWERTGSPRQADRGYAGFAKPLQDLGKAYVAESLHGHNQEAMGSYIPE